MLLREILQRLTSKCAAKAVADKAAGLLSPLQLDMGVRNGCEALVHTVRRLLDQEPEDFYLLQVDFVNAFNLADRSAAFEEAKKMFPELTYWIASCYGIEAVLINREHVIHSIGGFHQGDPWPPFLLAVVLQLLGEKIEEKLPDLKLNNCFFFTMVLSLAPQRR